MDNKCIHIKKYDASLAKQWNEFCREVKTPLFMFDRNYMDYHSNRFVDHSLLFYECDKLIAILPANEAEDKLISHGGLTYGGLLFDRSVKQHTINDVIRELISYMNNKGFRELIYKAIPHIYHEQPAEEAVYSLFQAGAVLSAVSASTVVKLSDPIQMPKGRKAQISRARREGVSVSCLAEKQDYERFIELENEVLTERHGIKAVHTAEELFMLHERFSDKIHLFGAIYEDKMIAGTVIYEYGQVIHTQYMASNSQGRQIGALDLAIATIKEKYRDSKLWLDFGISTEEDGKVLNEGLIAQKEGFGGRTNVYELWTLKL